MTEGKSYTGPLESTIKSNRGGFIEPNSIDVNLDTSSKIADSFHRPTPQLHPSRQQLN